MNIIRDLKEHPDSRKLLKQFISALAIWYLGIIMLCIAMITGIEFKEKLADADVILKAAAKVNSSPVAVSEGNSPMSEISDMAAELGVKDKVTQLGASASGLTLSISGIDTETFANIVRNISEKGFPVKSAELRAMTSKGKRELTVSFVIGGDNNEDPKND